MLESKVLAMYSTAFRHDLLKKDLTMHTTVGKRCAGNLSFSNVIILVS